MRLSAIRVFVNDIATAKAFYKKQLGLPLKADASTYGYCVFNIGGADLVVEAVAIDAPQEDRDMVGRFTGLSFSVPNVNEKYQELSANGVQFTGQPEKQFWGGVLATFQDPSMNQLQIVQLPADA